MFDTFVTKITAVLKDSTLRNRILFVLGALVMFRALAAIPIPGVDKLALETFFANNQYLGLFNIFSGGGLSNLSIVMLGVGPYITASIVMQLMTVLSPRLKAMYQEEGEAGRAKFAQYSRLLSVPLAFLQAFSFLILLQRNGIIVNLDFITAMTNVFIIAAGSLLLMWIGELVTEFGVGNGVSLIIFAGIVSRLPSTFSQLAFSFDPSQIPTYVAFMVAALVVTAGVVFITESERPIPITYARQTRGLKQYGGVSTYLPLRVNQAGVIPIIFAISLILLPQMVASFLAGANVPYAAGVVSFLNAFFANTLAYGLFYFVLVFVFTFFYTAVTFDPGRIAENLQKSGAFIPGVRPGNNTAEYVGNILTRITLVGAFFLGIIAVLPLIVQGLTGIQSLAIGGTALLIAVSVVLDLIKRIDAQVNIREY